MPNHQISPLPDGSNFPIYPMVELYFNNPEELQTALGSPEGEATPIEPGNFVSGGVTVIIGSTD